MRRSRASTSGAVETRPAGTAGFDGSSTRSCAVHRTREVTTTDATREPALAGTAVADYEGGEKTETIVRRRASADVFARAFEPRS
jgi:hypothetical protein